MATKHWLTGCGIGCLLTVVVAVIGGSLLFREAKRTFGEFEQVSAMQARLHRDYGGVEDYVPPADGRIPASRVEAYLRVQEAIKPAADALAANAEAMRGLEEDGFSLGKAVAAVRGVRDLGVRLGRVLAARNQALLDQGMGLGEHVYLTVLVEHGLLQRPLRLSIDGDESAERRRRVRRVLRGFLERQLDAARAAGDPAGLVPALEQELARFAADPAHVPWSDGLPPPTRESLAPYRARLEALSVDAGMLLGIGAEKDGGGFSFEIE